MVFFHGKTVFIWKSKCYDILDLELLLDKKYVYGCGCFCGRVSKNCKSLKATVKFIDSTNVRQIGPKKVRVGQSATHRSNLLISPVDIGSFLIHRKIDYKMLNTKILMFTINEGVSAVLGSFSLFVMIIVSSSTKNKNLKLWSSCIGVFQLYGVSKFDGCSSKNGPRM